MDVSVVHHPGAVAEVAVAGRLNMVTSGALREVIQGQIADNHPRIAIDLSRVVFLDSSGLGALIAGLKSARQAGGDVRLVRPAEQAQLVLELTNMNTVLQSFDSVSDAYPAA